MCGRSRKRRRVRKVAELMLIHSRLSDLAGPFHSGSLSTVVMFMPYPPLTDQHERLRWSFGGRCCLTNLLRSILSHDRGCDRHMPKHNGSTLIMCLQSASCSGLRYATTPISGRLPWGCSCCGHPGSAVPGLPAADSSTEPYTRKCLWGLWMETLVGLLMSGWLSRILIGVIMESYSRCSPVYVTLQCN